MIALIATKLGIPQLFLEIALVVLLLAAIGAAFVYHDHEVAAAARAKIEAQVAAAKSAEVLRQADVNAAARKKADAAIQELQAERDNRAATITRLSDEADHDAASAGCGIDLGGVRRLREIHRSPPAARPSAAGH